MVLAVDLIVGFRDAKNKRSSTRIHLQPTFSIAQYLEYADAALEIFDNLSKGEIESCNIGLGIDLSGAGLRTVGSVAADIAQKAFFGAASAVSGLFSKFFVPTAKDDLKSPLSQDLDLTDSDVSEFITLIEDGFTVAGTPITPVDERENDLALVTRTRMQFRNE